MGRLVEFFTTFHKFEIACSFVKIVHMKFSRAFTYLIFVSIALFSPKVVYSQDASSSALPQKPIREDYFRAEVVEILSEEKANVAGFDAPVQSLGLTIETGYEKGKDISTQYVLNRNGGKESLRPGDKVVLYKATFGGDVEQYQIIDKYRIDFVLYVFLLFLISVILMSGKKGIGSIIGMGFSLFVLIGIIAPLIIAGHNPLLVSIGGALLIMLVSIYLAHGISKQTTSAVVSTFVSLVLSGALSFVFVQATSLTGVGNEASYSLLFGLSDIDLKGLLLGGIIIGTLGILDDVTTSQAAVVFELYKTNQKLSYGSLVKKGLSVGREHITALVNTLFLVYAGVSLGLFVIFVLNPLNQPAWVLLNYQSMSEEIIRTLSGSLGLIFAVPISTLIAAFTVQRFVKDVKKRK